MKMKYGDQLGSLYSQEGLRFGGFMTSEFINSTEDIETKYPNSREQIIAEAHYQVFWRAFFADIVFLSSLILTQSLLLAILFFIGAYTLETIRLYIAGPYNLFSKISYLWSKIKFVVYVLVVIVLWQINSFLSISALVFSVVEGYFGLLGTIAILPIAHFLSMIFSRKQLMEGYIMHWTILEWQNKYNIKPKSTETL